MDAQEQKKKEKRKRASRKRGRKPTRLLTQSACAVVACSMGQTDSRSEHRHGKKENKNTESTVGRPAGQPGLLTGPEIRLGQKPAGAEQRGGEEEGHEGHEDGHEWRGAKRGTCARNAIPFRQGLEGYV